MKLQSIVGKVIEDMSGRQKWLFAGVLLGLAVACSLLAVLRVGARLPKESGIGHSVGTPISPANGSSEDRGATDARRAVKGGLGGIDEAKSGVPEVGGIERQLRIENRDELQREMREYALRAQQHILRAQQGVPQPNGRKAPDLLTPLVPRHRVRPTEPHRMTFGTNFVGLGPVNAYPAGSPVGPSQDVAGPEHEAAVLAYPNIEAPETVAAGQEIAVQVSLSDQQIAPGTHPERRPAGRQAEVEHGGRGTTVGLDSQRERTRTGILARNEHSADHSYARRQLGCRCLLYAAEDRTPRGVARDAGHPHFRDVVSQRRVCGPTIQANHDYGRPENGRRLVSPKRGSFYSGIGDGGRALRYCCQSPLSPGCRTTLTITENRVNNVLDINFNFSSEGTIEKNIDDASTLHMWINAHYAKMARYGRGFRPEHAETTLQSGNDYLNAFGRELYDKVVPEELQGVLYKALTDKRHPSIQVISDDPAIPWELIRIMDPQTHQRLLPLGELVSIARWPMSKEYVPRTHSMEASRSVVVAPQYSGGMTLAETTQELDAVLHTPTFQAMDGSYTSVRALAANPPQGFLHFAGHGEVIQEDGVTQYSILLKDGAIGPEAWASLKAPNAVAGTLYFFNACEVGEAGQFMNEVDGWAPALLGSGASGFIGALWPISDSTATLFATEFYKQLTLDLKADQQGAPISDVLTATRRQVFEQTHDPTALAYVFYGDPNLRVTAKIQ